jgi:hypothetical protein
MKDFDPNKGFFEKEPETKHESFLPEPVKKKDGVHKGRPRPAGSGRTKGTPNRSTLRKLAGLKPLKEQLEMMNFDPVKELVVMYQEEEDSQVRFKILEMLCDRMYPKLAAMKVEMNADKTVMPGQNIIAKAKDEILLDAIEKAEKTEVKDENSNK